MRWLFKRGLTAASSDKADGLLDSIGALSARWPSTARRRRDCRRVSTANRPGGPLTDTALHAGPRRRRCCLDPGPSCGAPAAGGGP